MIYQFQHSFLRAEIHDLQIFNNNCFVTGRHVEDIASFKRCFLSVIIDYTQNSI